MTTGSSSQDLHFLEREGQEGAEKMGVQVTIKSTMPWKGKVNVQNVVTKGWNNLGKVSEIKHCLKVQTIVMKVCC